MRPPRPLSALAFVLLTAAARPAGACDSTGCLMLTRGQGGLLPKGRFGLDLAYRLADMSRPLLGSEPTDLVTTPRIDYANDRVLPNYHRDVDGDDSGLQLEGSWGVATRTTLYASAPLLTLKSHQV